MSGDQARAGLTLARALLKFRERRAPVEEISSKKRYG